MTDETSDARSITLAVPEGLADSFRYRPGQFLTLRLAVGGRHLPRCYSMSSTPGLDDALRVTVGLPGAHNATNTAFAVLALLDRGWDVAVIDNLSTGFRFAVPKDVPFYEGDIEDAALETRQPRPLNGRLDRTIEDLGLGAGRR